MTLAHPTQSRLVDGKYALTRELGSGAAGVVYEGEHLLVGKRVALKLLRPELARNTALSRRFVAEARAAARIAHANVVDIFDLGVARDGTCYLVMELLGGETLQEILDQRGALPASYACELMLQVLAGLGAAHAEGIVHRDLKPANVMVTHPRPDRPLAKVLDFGIAKGVLDPALADEAGIVLGTPLYMAPEQALGLEVDARADLYSAAAILYELLSGTVPFAGATPDRVLAEVVAGPRRPLGDAAPWLPPRLVEVIEAALARDPQARPASAADFAAALRPFVGAGHAGSLVPSLAASLEPIPLVSSARRPQLKPTLLDPSQPALVLRLPSLPARMLRLPPRDPAASDSLLCSPRIPGAPCTPREVAATPPQSEAEVRPPEPGPEPEPPEVRRMPPIGARAVLFATAVGFSVGLAGAWLAGLI